MTHRKSYHLLWSHRQWTLDASCFRFEIFPFCYDFFFILSIYKLRYCYRFSFRFLNSVASSNVFLITTPISFPSAIVISSVFSSSFGGTPLISIHFRLPYCSNLFYGTFLPLLVYTQSFYFFLQFFVFYWKGTLSFHEMLSCFRLGFILLSNKFGRFLNLLNYFIQLFDLFNNFKIDGINFSFQHSQPFI